MLKSFVIICLLFAHFVSAAEIPSEAQFAQQVAKKYGLNAKEIEQTLQKAQRKQSILDAIARPAEGKPWHAYRKIFLTEKRIRQGIAYRHKYATALEKAEADFGVPAEIITAIIGVETYYGGNTGGYRVLDALYTLGFHYPPRSKFFLSELSHFLKLTSDEKISATQPTGSYAGAMGLPQFMPSSFLSYAIDSTDDGHRDIWQTHEDAIGSVANYFKRHHWQGGKPVARRIFGLSDAAKKLATTNPKPNIVLADLQLDHPIEGLDPQTPITLIRYESEKGPEYWIGFDNFYVITRYNHSRRYALAVYQLAEEIRKGVTL